MFKKYRENKAAKVSAKRWHDRAYAVAYEQGRTGNYDDEPVKFYEKAGQEWELAGDSTRAMEDYISALNSARKANEKRPGTISEERLSKLEKWVPKSLGPAWAITSIAGLLSGFFFLSTSITGNAVADLSETSSGFLGSGLLIVGLLGTFFWVQNRKK